MESLVVECLRCGSSRIARRDVFKHFDEPECPQCGYLGWAPMLELTEVERRDLRERPVAERSVA
jgi:hypothetical protein